MYYDYYLTSRFMGIPFVTDVRLLGFNKTTLENLGLELPPPHGRYDWTWENLRDTACAITEKYGVGGAKKTVGAQCTQTRVFVTLKV